MATPVGRPSVTTAPGKSAAAKEVKEGSLPDDEHSYGVNEAEFEKFAVMVAKRRQI